MLAATQGNNLHFDHLSLYQEATPSSILSASFSTDGTTVQFGSFHAVAGLGPSFSGAGVTVRLSSSEGARFGAQVNNNATLRSSVMNGSSFGVFVGSVGRVTDTLAKGVNAGLAADLGSDATLRNVTAIGTGPASAGILTFEDFPGAAPIVNARAVIARGVAKDLQIDRGQIQIDHSNFVTTSGTVVAGAGNQTADPLFDGAYRLSPGSPAIDAGVLDGNSGSEDVDGGARVVGAAVDIGADEAPPAPAPTPAPSPTPTPPADLTPPGVSGLKTGLDAKRRASLTLKLNEAATVTALLERRASKRRYVKVKRVVKRLAAGTHKLKLGNRALGVGTYRVTVTARDAAGNTSLKKQLTLVVKRKKK